MDAKQLRDGEPCNHPGCLSHISHPCEGCGRIGGKNQMASNQGVKVIDLKQAKELRLFAIYEDGKIDEVGTTHLKQLFEHIESLNRDAKLGRAAEKIYESCLAYAKSDESDDAKLRRVSALIDNEMVLYRLRAGKGGE